MQNAAQDTQHTRARDFEPKTMIPHTSHSRSSTNNRRKARFNLTLETPADGNQHVRFKRLLKLAGRACGLRAIDYHELSADGPPPAPEPTPPTPAPRGEGER